MSNPAAKQSAQNLDKRYVKMASALDKTPEDRIRERAYQIYESNGRQDHHADQDWFQAELELLSK